MSQNSTDTPNYINIPGHPSNNYGEMLASTFPNTRLIVMDNGLGILTNAEEEQINFVVSCRNYFILLGIRFSLSQQTSWEQQSTRLTKISKCTVCPHSHDTLQNFLYLID